MDLDVYDASSIFAFIRDEDLAAGHFQALPGHIA